MVASNIDLDLPPEAAGIERLTGDYVHQWSTRCGSFWAWERRQMLRTEPSLEIKEEHRESLKWLLRLTRLLHSLAADPEFPDRLLADELEGRLLQLESSWRMFYEAMPVQEAEKLLNEVFPNER